MIILSLIADIKQLEPSLTLLISSPMSAKLRE